MELPTLNYQNWFDSVQEYRDYLATNSLYFDHFRYIDINDVINVIQSYFDQRIENKKEICLRNPSIHYNDYKDFIMLILDMDNVNIDVQDINNIHLRLIKMV